MKTHGTLVRYAASGGWNMRRFAFVLLAVAVGFVALGPPVAAEPDAGLNRQVSGAFAGTSVFDDDAPQCPFGLFVYQVHDATYTTANGRSGSFHLAGCVDVAPIGFSYSGLFVVTTPNGAILNGTVTGVIGGTSATGPCEPPTPAPVALDFTLALTQGTRSFQHTTGTIHLTGTWCSPLVPFAPGPIFGTLTGALQRG
jgi:hypothetical protein